MRIDWSDEEERKVAEAAKTLLQKRGVSLPVATPFAKPSMVLAAIREAVAVVLPPERQRTIASAETVAGLGPRLVELQIISAEDAPGRATPKPANKDKLRVEQLADERDEALKMAAQYEAERNAAQAEVRLLRSQLQHVPTESEVIKNFLADVIGGAMQRARAPGSISKEANLTQEFVSARTAEAAARAERTRLEEEAAAKGRKPKIVLLGGEHYDRIHAEVKDLADMRFIDTRGNAESGLRERLMAFKTNPKHGRILVWDNLTNHSVTKVLTDGGIPFKRFSGGSHTHAIDAIKQAVAELTAS